MIRKIKDVVENRKKEILIVALAVALLIVLFVVLGKGLNRGGTVIEQQDRTEGAEELEREQENIKGEKSDNDFLQNESETVPITPPIITEETICGADGPILDYGDEHLIIFHDYFGLFAYDIMESKLIGAIDLASIGCQHTQGDDYCEVLTASNGWMVYLHPVSSESMYVYDVLNNRLTKEPFDPEGKEAFYHLKNTTDCVESQPYMRSFYCAPLKEYRYLYLESASGMAMDLYYIIEKNHERVRFAKIFDEYPIDRSVGLFDYGNYTGYLDECVDWRECVRFQGTDYDGDGLIDRVYRKNLVDFEHCNYRIEFGNGDVIDIPQMGGGMPDVQSCDLDGDGNKEILFQQYYGFSTDPMAFGETAIFVKLDGSYEQLLPPEDLCAYMKDEEFDEAAGLAIYQPCLTLCYDKQSEWEMRVMAKELAKIGILDEMVPMNDDVAAMFNNPNAEKEHRSVCYETTVVPGASSGDKELLEFHFEVFGKWSMDEVVVTAVYEDGELKIAGSRYVSEEDKKEDFQGLNFDISSSEAVVVPEMELPEFEEISSQGEVKEYAGTLPGSDEGVWYLVTADGIEYIYGRYHYEEKENYHLFSWALRDDDHALANGLKVGMTEEEALQSCPNLVRISFEGEGWPAWNGIAYPDNWVEEFDYALIANVENHEEELPVFLALMIKSGKVAAITQYEPTAG